MPVAMVKYESGTHLVLVVLGLVLISLFGFLRPQ